MTFDEWFHKEYEPADLQIKQYAENKEGLHIPATVYLEDLKKAFEAGQKGKVVEHFEAYGQCRDSRRIAELERKLEQTEKDLADYQFNYPTIKELQKENAELKSDNDARKFAMAMSEKVEKQLREEIAELKEKKIKGCYFGKDELGNDFFAKCDCVDCQKRVIALLDLRKEYLNKINKESYLNDQLTKAKELLERLLITSCNSDVLNLLPNCSEVLRVRVEAEQFLSEVEK